MDLAFRFWNNNTSEVNTRYFTSAFLGHVRAVVLVQAFLDNVPEKIMNKIIQVSMDGPKVNTKFLKDIQENIIFKDDKSLINIGTCGLHVIHNGFKNSFKESGWNIGEFLQALFYLFEYSPALREDYVSIGKTRVFPLNFTNTRWVGNAPVAQRTIQVIGPVAMYVQKND